MTSFLSNRRNWIGMIALVAIAMGAPSKLLAQKSDTAKPAASAKQDKKQDKPNYKDRFIRIRRDADKKPVAMETSIVRYFGKNKEGEKIVVDLIGVVHIGEREYYEQLNDRFDQYDALLYELVAPEGTRIPKGGGRKGGANPIAALQKGMQASLGLKFQLDLIDYTKDNFIHADMTPTEFMESMKNNNESMLKTVFRAMGQSMAMQTKNAKKGKNSDAELLMAMFSDDREYKLRQVMAEQMQDIESGMLIFEGDNGSTIINHRNRKALTVMEREIKNGKKKIGVFYGAGHLPDMEERLLRDFGMKRAGAKWLPAWNLQRKK